MAAATAELPDGGKPIVTVEVVVDQQSVRLEPGCLKRRYCFSEASALEHAAAPAVKKRLHPVEDGGLIVDAKHDHSIELSVLHARTGHGFKFRGNPGGTRHFDREARAAADL